MRCSSSESTASHLASQCHSCSVSSSLRYRKKHTQTHCWTHSLHGSAFHGSFRGVTTTGLYGNRKSHTSWLSLRPLCGCQLRQCIHWQKNMLSGRDGELSCLPLGCTRTSWSICGTQVDEFRTLILVFGCSLLLQSCRREAACQLERPGSCEVGRPRNFLLSGDSLFELLWPGNCYDCTSRLALSLCQTRKLC